MSVAGEGANPTALRPDAYASRLTERVPELQQLAEVETRILFNRDSSDIGPPDWTTIATTIADARTSYEGFVVVHGTDTMAYTASALSFALGELDRPVVLTGSQRPLGELRTDARRNLVDAVDLATRAIPEVGICFDGRLLRGNRATKGDAWSYAAFASPTCPPLARLGLDVEIAPHLRQAAGPFACHPHFDPSIVHYRVVPGVDPRALLGMVDATAAKGVVISALGVGNAPALLQPLAPIVAMLTARGLVALVITQAWAGTVDLDRYENGTALARAGAISGGDMSVEAATTKLMHALARYPGNVAAQQKYLLTDVAGERSDTASATARASSPSHVE